MPEDETEMSEINLALKEHQALVKEIIRRGELVPLTGAILIISALEIFRYGFSIGNAIGNCERFLIFLFALFLYAVWLFSVAWTTRWLDEKTYARIRGIEKSYDFQAYRYLRKKLSGHNKIILELRHLIWGHAFLILTLLGAYLLYLKN